MLAVLVACFIGAMTKSMMTLNMTTFSLTPLSKMTLGIAILGIVMPSVAFIYCYDECRSAECLYTERRGAIFWKGS